MDITTDIQLQLTSAAFKEGEHIPRKYTCEGEDINPPLKFEGFPRQTKTLALTTEDPDTGHGVFDHWLVWNIRPNEVIRENDVPGIYGRNSFGKNAYGGPCPPTDRHRYIFTLYALDTELDLPPGSSKDELEKAMQGHILATGQLMGYYEKGL